MKELDSLEAIKSLTEEEIRILAKIDKKFGFAINKITMDVL